MNEIVLAVLNHNYKDTKFNKYKFIYRRTKKERIKDKIFSKLFWEFIKQTEIAIIGKVVILEHKKYLELTKFADNK